jgi:hypothetical protein
MAEDKLQKYQSIIDDLKLQLGDPNFDHIFAQKTTTLSKPDQFLLKMEMSRLSQPVARFIDLRGQVAGDVKPYEHDGKQHFMDSVAVAVFEEELARHGKYTLAVYEAVMHTENNYRVMQKKQEEQVNTQQAEAIAESGTKLIRFASYESRCEERMNYSIKITIDFGKNGTVSATTSDISLSGAKIKVPVKYSATPGQLIGIRLVGLEQDFELGLKGGIQYEVIAVEPVSREYQHIRLKRTFIENNSGFDEFLESFIHGNKRRYKINLDNTMDAVVCKGYEQFYLPRVSSLFVYFSKKGKYLLPTIALTNENNAFVNYYFEDERKVSSLYSIFSQSRLAKILALPNAVKETTLYTFTHSNGGKIYYYSAFGFELDEHPELKSLFLGFGSQKESWRTFKIQLMPSHHEDAYIPLSLPLSAGKNVEKLNKRPTPRVQGIIQDVKFLMLLTDISSQQQRNAYQSHKFDSNSVNKLKKFGHGRAANPPALEVVALEYVNLRSHKRYLYKTAVKMHINAHNIVSGNTRDFSVMGLQLETPTPSSVNKGDIVNLELPDLQKITKQHKLNNLRYEVMAVSKSKTIVNLKVSKLTDLPHVGMDFFKQLIEMNKSKLHACEESPKIPGLSTALRNMVTKTVCQFPLYIHKESALFNIGAIGLGLYPTNLHKLLMSYHKGSPEKLDATNLFPKKFIEERLHDLFRHTSRQDKPLKYTVFIRFDCMKERLHEAINSQCIAYDEPIDSLYLFLKKAVKKDMLFVFQLHISKTGRPDTDYLANELKYVSHYALHKAKDLEESLWSVTGVCDLIDISDEAIQQLDIEPRYVNAMQERKRAFFDGLMH